MIIEHTSCKQESELLDHLGNDKESGYRLLGIFLREINEQDDELMVVTQKDATKKLYTYVQSNQQALPKISNIYYDAFMYQNEIYDFYGKPTKDSQNYTLRLHLHPDNYFPKRKKWSAMIQKKNPYVFTKVEWEALTEVQVGPIHAWIIPPGHFRFMVDGEDTQNLDTKMGRKHRGVESYFMNEKELSKLLDASQEIAWDSAVAYATTFAKLIEQSSRIVISHDAQLMRIILLELERIYNHLRTLWALANDVGQAFILNGFLAIREQFLELNESLFASRILKHTIALWGVNKVLSQQEQENVHTFLQSIKNRLNNLISLSTKGSGNYDRFKDTGIVLAQTARTHGALGVSARASTLAIDERIFDDYYISCEVKVDICLGEQWDSLDRFIVRANECIVSLWIIESCMGKLSSAKEQYSAPSKLKDGTFIATTEWHRGQILQLMVVENWEIVYFKIKDPSFVNWNLLEYAVLNNIIADFPICNKSFDLSYSGFDL
jgi:formate hydrogenlyase subunit 5